MIRKFITVLFAFCLIAYSQTQTLTIDEAISESMKYFSAKLTAGMKVVILNFESENKNLSDYIIDESSVFILNNPKLSLVDKSKLPNILEEKNINDLNEINETVALEIGKKLGASSVIFGSISKLGANYRFRVQALSTANGQVLGMQSLNVKEDEILADLLGTGVVLSEKPVPKGSPSRQESEFNDLSNVRSKGGLGDSQSARARLEAESAARGNPESSQSVNNSNPNIQVIIVKDTVVVIKDAAAAVASAPKEPQKPQKRSRFFLSNKFQFLEPVGGNGDVMRGYEFEIGGLKRNKLLFTGTSSFARSPDNNRYYYDYNYNYNSNNIQYNRAMRSFGWGAGLFIAPVISAGEIFKFVPGINAGFWYYFQEYDYDYNYNYNYGGYYNDDRSNSSVLSYECLWGGPDIRLMLGYKFVYVDFFYKVYFGLSSVYNPDDDYYNNYYYDSYTVKFRAKNLWGIGFSFIIGRRN